MGGFFDTIIHIHTLFTYILDNVGEYTVQELVKIVLCGYGEFSTVLRYMVLLWAFPIPLTS
jgi:hypothetical protein